ncbi:MAG: sulfide/dihydroorotate dehydrogenase-like FAD/NAD-binding protein [Micrococcales bacterium]|nr:sulfide/dihydroorotate dehydrogenase-like FAD/NAD-binding protein [Micrococcales bacterium]MCL2668131.1 sulfide/dihydroorotate dehydrogenase-like FAD/NAD-binding protein [Micrococcales bacterium]
MTTTDSTPSPVETWLGAKAAHDASVAQVSQLEGTREVVGFRQQMDLLQRRLAADPRSFRQMFLSDGMAAIAAEFRGTELSRDFTVALWDVLSRDDAASVVTMRFIWNLPIGKKRLFIRAIDHYLRDRYPMFEGLSDNWPLGNGIEPYIRPPEERSQDFSLVNTGYLGYMALGFTQRDTDLLVWLEALRDKQCSDSPCELGELMDGSQGANGGCPVRIHIPQMFELLGQGRFAEALEMMEESNPLPNVTGRVCPQELQCQGMCLHKKPMSIGQVEWFLPERAKIVDPDSDQRRFGHIPDPWVSPTKPPVAIVGSGPSGLINAYLLAVQGFPVTVFEAFHELGGVLRYGIPEFRLPNSLIDDVVRKIRLLGGRFVTNFVVGKTATLEDLREAGFWKIFVGSGAGLPKFMGVPGEELLNVMSANEFLTRVNLMQAAHEDHETPLPEVEGKHVIVIGGGNTAMDAARTAKRLRGDVTIVYRRTQAEMPARVEELHHALEEEVALMQLHSPTAFHGTDDGFVNAATIEEMELGEPDSSGRRRPVATGRTSLMPVDLVIMALGNAANPIIKDSEPNLAVSRWGTIELEDGSQETSIEGIYSGGDAARGGSTAILAAGDGQSAARQILDIEVPTAEVVSRVDSARAYTDAAGAESVILAKRNLSPGIEEFVVRAPVIARSAQAGQFVRVYPADKGELIPLTLADWDPEAGTITLVVQDVGVSSALMNAMEPGDVLVGVAGPLGRPSVLHKYPATKTVVFTAGGLGLPPVYPIMREHLRLGNHVTLINGFRTKDLMFWDGEDEYVGALQAEFGKKLDVVYTTDDGTFGTKGFVTTPLEKMLKAKRPIAEVIAIGPSPMMRAVADLTRGYKVPTVASLNAIMVDATGMCGACMVPVEEDGKLVRKHACIDGPEIDAHAIDWDKFLPRFGLFKKQEQAARARHKL